MENSSESLTKPHANLQKNICFSSQTIFKPKTVEELQQIVRENKNVKAQGSLHCFNASADTYPDGVFVSTENFKSIEVGEKSVTFGSGCSYVDLVEPLNAAGLAVQIVLNYGKINIVGSVLACGHGSGYNNKIIAAYISWFEFVQADGQVVSISKENPEFYAHLISFGRVGIITRMTMDAFPKYYLYRHLHLDLKFGEWQQVDKQAHSMEIFFDYKSEAMAECFASYKCEQNHVFQLPEEEKELQQKRIPEKVGLLLLGQFFPSQEVGIWSEKIFAVTKETFLPDDLGIQCEYFIEYDQLENCLKELKQIDQQIRVIAPILLLRTVAADDIPMSPAKGKRVVALHFHFTSDHNVALETLKPIEEILLKFECRIHLGKLFSYSVEKF